MFLLLACTLPEPETVVKKVTETVSPTVPTLVQASEESAALALSFVLEASFWMLEHHGESTATRVPDLQAVAAGTPWAGVEADTTLSLDECATVDKTFDPDIGLSYVADFGNCTDGRAGFAWIEQDFLYEETGVEEAPLIETSELSILFAGFQNGELRVDGPASWVVTNPLVEGEPILVDEVGVLDLGWDVAESLGFSGATVRIGAALHHTLHLSQATDGSLSITGEGTLGSAGDVGKLSLTGVWSPTACSGTGGWIEGTFGLEVGGVPLTLPLDCSLSSGVTGAYSPAQLGQLTSTKSCSSCDLTGAALTKANLTDANLTDANLTEANLTEAALTWASMSGATLVLADLEKADLYLADLTEADLTAADLSSANLTSATLTQASLDYATLTKAYLISANLTEATLTRAKLNGAALTSAKLTSADLRYATLSSASMSSAGLTGANLSGANLTGASLTGANLTEANLTGANLTGASLSLANLTGANLTDANLIGADIVFADVTNVIWSNTTCPSGRNSNNNGNTCVSRP